MQTKTPFQIRRGQQAEETNGQQGKESREQRKATTTGVKSQKLNSRKRHKLPSLLI